MASVLAYQATWSNVNLSKVLCDIHLRANSQEVLMNSICNMCSEITLKKLLAFS